MLRAYILQFFSSIMDFFFLSPNGFSTAQVRRHERCSVGCRHSGVCNAVVGE